MDARGWQDKRIVGTVGGRVRRWILHRLLPALLVACESGCMTQRWAASPAIGGPGAATLAPVAAPPGGAEGRWPSPEPGHPGIVDPAARRTEAQAEAGAKPDAEPGPTPPTVPAATMTDVAGPEPGTIVPTAADYPIDLTAALRLAEATNPVIGEARARIGEALALQQGARVLLLPTLNAGTNYHAHNGNLQRSSGRILSLSEQSLYFGGGSRTLAAESLSFPAVRIFSPLADAAFEPLAARQRVAASRATAAATANDVLLEVATLYLELGGAEARLEALRATVAEAREVERLTVAYARVGQKPESDANRSRTELALFLSEAQRAEEDVAVASARLVRRLSIDPTVRVRPVGPGLVTITLVDPTTPVQDLIRTALRRRPDMISAGASVGEAQAHYRQEMARPLLPTISVGFSGGAFGGGSNLVPPLVGNFGGRTDFDVFAIWTLQNFGMGNLGLQRNRRAAVGQADAELATVANRVRREVREATARAAATARIVEVARQQLQSSEAGYRADLRRAEGAVGRPIEVLDSLKLLNRARLELIRAIIDYDEAQFALFVSLGSPPPLAAPVPAPTPPAPAPTAPPGRG